MPGIHRGLGPVATGRIEADADHVIETATADDGTTLWPRRGRDQICPYWPASSGSGKW
jgi:hypothetical protein